MRLRSVVAVVAVALVASGALSSALAQSAASTPGDASRLASLASSGSRSDSVSDIEISLPSVTASGAPRSYQVIPVPIPEAFARVMKLEVEVVPRGDFVVLGARARSLPISPGAGLL